WDQDENEFNSLNPTFSAFENELDDTKSTIDLDSSSWFEEEISILQSNENINNLNQNRPKNVLIKQIDLGNLWTPKSKTMKFYCTIRIGNKKAKTKTIPYTNVLNFHENIPIPNTSSTLITIKLKSPTIFGGA